MQTSFYFPFTDMVRSAISNKVWQSDSCNQAAKKISEYYFKGDENQSINNLFKIIYAIDEIRNKFARVKEVEEKTNFLVNLIGEYASNNLLIFRESSRNLTKASKNLGDNVSDLVGVTVKNIHNQLANGKLNMNYFSSLSPYLTLTIEKFEDHLDLKSSVNDVFKELVELRKYGIKSSSFQDSLLVSPGHYSMFLPTDYLPVEFALKTPYSFNLRERIKNLQGNKIVMVAIGKNRNLKISKHETEIYRTHAFDSISSFFSIDIYGELCNWNNISQTNLKSFFEQRDKSGIYDLLRANTIFRLYDLIIPEAIYRKYKLPTIPTSTKLLGWIPVFDNFDPKIYLRRIRVLFDNLNEIKQTLELEFQLSNNNIETKIYSNALKKKYGIVCHIRNLPRGYMVSKKAKQLAREILNYDLKDEETFTCSQGYQKGQSKQNSHLQIIKF